MSGNSAVLDNPYFIPVDTVGESLEVPGLNGQLARIPGIRNIFEGEVIRDALCHEGIPCVIESNQGTAWGDLFVMQQSWGSVLLRMESVEQAWAIIVEIREGMALSGRDLPEELQADPDEEA